MWPRKHHSNLDFLFQAEFEGKALFDIERLMSYKSAKDKSDAEELRKSRPEPGPKPKAAQEKAKVNLKFFDPLCSPEDGGSNSMN